jgi:O-Antigen ligase
MRISSRIIEIGMIFIFIFSPLAFGAVETWAYTIVEIVSGIILLSFLVYLHTVRKLYHSPPLFPLQFRGRRILPLFLGLGLFIVGVLIQLIPIPLSFIRTISPATAKFWLLTGINPTSWRPLSCYPGLTFSELLKLLSYLIISIVLFLYQPRGKTKVNFISSLIIIIIMVGFIISMVGIIQHFSCPGKLYGFREIKSGSSFGPYVNRNHFAGYIQMVLPLGLGVFLSLVLININSRPAGFKQLLLNTDPRILLIGFGSVIMAIALLLSLSRGGIISFLGSMVYFIILAGCYRMINRRIIIWFVILMVIIILMVVIYFDFDPVLSKFIALKSAHASTVGRLGIWRDSWNIFEDFPVIGTGWNSFIKIYPYYSTADPRYLYTHTENDYIQLLGEMGIWGGSCLLFIIVSYFYAIPFKIRLKSRHRIELRGQPHGEKLSLSKRCIVLGSSTAVAGILLHSIVNFNLKIPANTLLFFALATCSLITLSPVKKNENI